MGISEEDNSLDKHWLGAGRTFYIFDGLAAYLGRILGSRMFGYALSRWRPDACAWSLVSHMWFTLAMFYIEIKKVFV